MTTKLEYLKKCIVSGSVIESKKWYISCFAIPLLKNEVYNIDDKEQYSIVVKIDGLYFLDYNENNELIENKIVDYKTNEPLFKFQDVIEVDGTWLPTIESKISTKIGVLIVNSLILYPSVGKKIPYINRSIRVSDIETIFVNKVKNDDIAKDTDIKVSEMIDCIDRLGFLSSLATITNIAATSKTITPPPNIDSIKKKLLEEYKDQLDNPVKVVELENKLTAIDNEYLADDPAANNIFNKKSKTARKKLFLMYGETQDFLKTNDSKVVIKSLQEGIETSKDVFPLFMNDLRSASFDRGASTALSGYSYKILQRSLSGLRISKTPCNTTRGLVRSITKDNYKKLVNRYIKNKNWLLIENIDQAKEYIGKEVEIRSPMYCTSSSNSICYACMSENYKNLPSGITNLASGISSVLMNAFLKKMHSSITETTNIELKDLVT